MDRFVAQQSAASEATSAIMDSFRLLVEEFGAMKDAAIGFLPKLILAAMFFLIAWIIAKLIRVLISKACDRLKLDDTFVKLGIREQLAKVGLRQQIGKLLGGVVFWVILAFALRSSANMLGVEDISNFVGQVMAFFPKLLVAGFIFFGGMMIGDLVRNGVQSALDNIGFEYSALIARALYILIGVMIATVVLNQLGIDAEIIGAVVKIVLAALGLAVALALGLGMRPIAHNVISGVYARDIYQPGCQVEVNSEDVELVEIGAVATRFEQENGEFFVVPNSDLLSHTNRGRTRAAMLEKNSEVL